MIFIPLPKMNNQNIQTVSQPLPLILVVSRVVFVALITGSVLSVNSETFPYSQIDIAWLLYLVVLYFVAEKTYHVFRGRGIDLAYAFPLLLAVFILNITSTLLDAQERLPLLNRAEHFASFVLIGYVVWTFFLQYLPLEVWKEHPYYTALLVISVTSAFGVGNEIIELVMDTLFGTRHIGDRFDTALDLLMNTLGTGIFLAVRLILGSKTQPLGKE